MRGLGVAITSAAMLAILPAAAAPESVAGGEAGAPSAGRWRAVASGATVPTFLGLSALSSRDVWAVGSIGEGQALTPVAAHWNGRSLRIRKPFPGSRGELTAVAAVSPDDVWALGNLRGGPVLAHWDGRGWRRVTTPQLGDTSLWDVAATSGGDVWVVGNRRVRTRVTDPVDTGVVVRPLVMHWNGDRWKVQQLSALVVECPYRDREGTGDSFEWVWECETYLGHIDAVSPRDVWAVGTGYFTVPAGTYPVFLHSNGRKWSQLEAPLDSGGIAAVDLTVSAPEDAWTLDTTVAESSGDWTGLIHWQSGKPRRFAYPGTPGTIESALAAVSSTSVWIVGERVEEGRSIGPLVIHWNGRSAVRQRTALDSLRNATLTSVSAVSPTEIWAAGAHLIARYSR